MSALLKPAKKSLRQVQNLLQSGSLSYPKRIACNVCGWTGRRLMSTPWHRAIKCPRCRTGVRQRLFVAALENLDNVSFARLIDGRRVLHFAPERALTAQLEPRAAEYRTADFLVDGVDLRLDICAMPEIADESVDALLAFDVLEHVPDDKQALREIRRTLAPGGCAILTVPQVDGMETTFEDPTVTTPEGRLEKFGQVDHVRLYGNDFPEIVADQGYAVTAVDESAFSDELRQRHVLAPPKLSTRSLATNYRKVFFCQKPMG